MLFFPPRSLLLFPPRQSEPVKKQAHWKGTSRIEDGFVETVNERIDLSIFRRCQLYKDYRPPNLREWAGRKGFDLEKIIAAPEQYADLYAPVTKPGLEGFNSPGG